jgi:hypothetical protein
VGLPPTASSCWSAYLVGRSSDRASLVVLVMLHPEQLDWYRPEELAGRHTFVHGFGFLGAGSMINVERSP